MIRYEKNRLMLGDNSEEMLAEDSGEMPFICNFNESNIFIGHRIPWHWHGWFEINYTEKGSYRLQASDQVIEVRQGEAVFINGGVLHAYDFPHESGYYSLLCDARFLAGEHGSYLDRKYFSPVFRSKQLSFVHIKPDTAKRTRMIGQILELLDILREEPKGYELAVWEALGRFFLLLSEEAEEILIREQAVNERDTERMKLMLHFIYANHMEQIGLTVIAETAGISARECTRCFKRSINRSPVRFLIEYRTQMAAAMLLQTGKGISEIAAACGFMSDSYFGKIFRELYGCSPREYRKLN